MNNEKRVAQDWKLPANVQGYGRCKMPVNTSKLQKSHPRGITSKRGSLLVIHNSNFGVQSSDFGIPISEIRVQSPGFTRLAPPEAVITSIALSITLIFLFSLLVFHCEMLP